MATTLIEYTRNYMKTVMKLFRTWDTPTPAKY